MYKIGDDYIEIHKEALKDLSNWNLSQPENEEIDYHFGLLVLLSLTSESQIAAGETNENAMSFMQGNYLFDLR